MVGPPAAELSKTAQRGDRHADVRRRERGDTMRPPGSTMIGAMAQMRGRDSGWAGPGVLGMLALGGVALVGVAIAGPTVAPTTRVAQIAAISLSDDDGSRALFASHALVPGQSVARCLTVSYAGGSDPGAVRLAATDVGRAPAPQLRGGVGGGP